MKKIFYRVQKGDTLSLVASKFSIPAHYLIKLNGLTSEIEEGDLLYLEILDRKVYSVQFGDTLDSVAEKFSLPKDELVEINGVPYLYYGMDIFV